MKMLNEKEMLQDCVNKILKHSWSQKKEILGVLKTTIPAPAIEVVNSASKLLDSVADDPVNVHKYIPELLTAYHNLIQMSAFLIQKRKDFNGSNGHIMLACLISSVYEVITLPKPSVSVEKPKIKIVGGIKNV